MHLNLRSLQDVREHVEQSFTASQFEGVGGDGFRVVSPVALAFDIERQGAGRYRVTGRLSGQLELICSRCLEPFATPMAADFDLRFVPRTENVGEGEQQVEEDDLSTSFYADDQIDLGELMAEQFQLALPMKPLCRETCKGLCPQCGMNLNTGSCECDPRWIDPRLAVLKNLGSKH